LASLLIIFTLFTAPNERSTSFFFFMATVNHPLSRAFSFFGAPNASLSVRDKTKIKNSFNNARLTVFAQSIFFALIKHSCDHDTCFSPWYAAQRLRDAGEMPAHISVL
jgi:hypothetical protein